jgi:preflagellin peptidase FlaK
MFIEIIKVIVTLGVFVKASLEDLKTREIQDKLWLLMLSLSIPLNIAQYVQQPFDLTFAILQFVLIFVLATLMYYLLGFGGADCKALICLSLMFPTYPQIFEFTTKGLIFALTVLTNSVIVAPLIVVYFFVKNAVKGDFAKTMFIGYKVKIDDIPKFHKLLEWVENDGKVVISLKGKEFNDDVVRKLKKVGVREVWVTPALPFIIFMTFGFVVAVTIGDVMFIILNRLA